MPSAGVSPKGIARREQILNAAFELIARDGYRGSTLGALARDLDIETPHILYYFGSREELLKEVLSRWDERSVAQLEDDDDFLTRFKQTIRNNLALRGIVHLYLSFAVESADDSHPSHDYFRARFEATFDRLTATIQSGQERGHIRRDYDARLLARMVVALADGLQLQAMLDPDVSAPDDLDAIIDGLYTAKDS